MNAICKNHSCLVWGRIGQRVFFWRRWLELPAVGYSQHQTRSATWQRSRAAELSDPLDPTSFWFLSPPFASFCLRNQPLREAYCIEKQLMLRERGEDQVNEQLLLHGHLMRSHFNMVWTWCNCTSLQLDIPASANVCSRYFSSDLHNYHTKIIAGCLRLPHVETLFEGTRAFDPVAIIKDRDGFMVEKGCVMYWQRID